MSTVVVVPVRAAITPEEAAEAGNCTGTGRFGGADGAGTLSTVAATTGAGAAEGSPCWEALAHQSPPPRAATAASVITGPRILFFCMGRACAPSGGHRMERPWRLRGDRRPDDQSVLIVAIDCGAATGLRPWPHPSGVCWCRIGSARVTSTGIAQ